MPGEFEEMISLHDQSGVFGVEIAENCSGRETAPVTKTWNRRRLANGLRSTLPLIASKEGAPLRVVLTNDNGPGGAWAGHATSLHLHIDRRGSQGLKRHAQSADHSRAVSFSYVHRARVSLPFHIREVAFGPGNQPETYIDNCFAIARCT